MEPGRWTTHYALTIPQYPTQNVSLLLELFAILVRLKITHCRTRLACCLRISRPRIGSIGLDESTSVTTSPGFTVLPTQLMLAFNYTLTESDRFFAFGEDGDDAGAFSQICVPVIMAECKPPVFIGTPFPTAPYEQNLFYIGVGYLLGLALTMATLYPVSRLIKDLVEEKETRMRETMAAMGISLTVNALAWFTSALILFTWLAGMMTWIARNSFIPRSDVWVIFLYFWLLLVSEIALSFLVSACFSRARLASLLARCTVCNSPARYIFFGSNR